jgi:hypothetical protein
VTLAWAQGEFRTDVECDCFSQDDEHWQRFFRHYFDFDLPQILIAHQRETFAIPVANSRCILLELDADGSHSYIYFGDTTKDRDFHEQCAIAANVIGDIQTTDEQGQTLAPSVQSGAWSNVLSNPTTGTHLTFAVPASDPSTFPDSLAAPSPLTQ